MTTTMTMSRSLLLVCLGLLSACAGGERKLSLKSKVTATPMADN
jgi:hypothetical protein